MNFTYERKINYYETDRMGVVHHSNYLRYLEEARCNFLDKLEMPFSVFEEKNITIPVLHVSCSYKNHVTFGDIILIRVFVKEYSGVKLAIGYDVINKNTGNTVIIAETKHCFTNMNLKPINFKKICPEFSEKFEKMNKLYKVNI